MSDQFALILSVLWTKVWQEPKGIQVHRMILHEIFIRNARYSDLVSILMKNAILVFSVSKECSRNVLNVSVFSLGIQYQKGVWKSTEMQS